MNKLIRGAIKFMQEDFAGHERLFRRLKDRQNPHTLFIGCSDSRILPHLITNTGPGELFVVRNIANIIPPYRVSEPFLATTSAIEYAINFLRIKNIIICAHSNCGGLEALYSPESEFEKMPNVRSWLSLLSEIKEEVLRVISMEDECVDEEGVSAGEIKKDEGEKLALRSWLSEKLNLLSSLSNLLSYPGVAAAVEEKKISIHAWYFIIETGEIYEYDLEHENFILLAKKEEE